MTRPERPLYYTTYCQVCWRQERTSRPMRLAAVEEQLAAAGWQYREGRGWRCPSCPWEEKTK